MQGVNVLHLLGGAVLGFYFGWNMGGLDWAIGLAVLLPVSALLFGTGTANSGGGWGSDCGSGDGGGD